MIVSRTDVNVGDVRFCPCGHGCDYSSFQE